ncbi:RHS repeat-associated core domain-containing protein [Pseudomonas sp. R5(2019)]|uniref:RHS repeat-associated core domain-containing protein n=1 Tax=Pseudomonas sp. R5(2019) TaxID=2697566 RepID=UPI002114ED4A|nr:RHS repeat-associated core domain-containing protein [Pseudomonas sp. R5(2019)]
MRSFIHAELIACDGANTVFQVVAPEHSISLTYTAYGFGLGRFGQAGFNGEFQESMTGHYGLGNGHRSFNPILQRFNSPDRLSPFGVGGINSYAYCQGDPRNFVDPSGQVKFRQVRVPRRFVRTRDKQPATQPYPLSKLETLTGRPFDGVMQYLSGEDLQNFRLVSRALDQRIQKSSLSRVARLITSISSLDLNTYFSVVEKPFNLAVSVALGRFPGVMHRHAGQVMSYRSANATYESVNRGAITHYDIGGDGSVSFGQRRYHNNRGLKSMLYGLNRR